MSEAGADDAAGLARAIGKRPWPWSETASLWLTRQVLLRGLAFIYAVAFFSLSRQMDGLIGSHGLLPVARFLGIVREAAGAAAIFRVPTLFWLASSDGVLHATCYAGLGLSLLALFGISNALVMGALWLLYSSFVHVGQVFYGYGWELLTLEAGFLAIFLAAPPRFGGRAGAPPPVAIVWLLRWLTFRVMLGAGLIKLRGDPCWVHLTCLVDHYQTQPNPSPLSYYFHALPGRVNKLGVLFNHFAELVVPWGVLGPRRIRHAAGAVIIAFQGVLILSGNLSFLNWLTIVVATSCFDDSLLLGSLPRGARERFRERIAAASRSSVQSAARRLTLRAVVGVVLTLSVFPVVNMISPDQRMNASFDPLRLVNTYGAFGSVEHERHEVVLEGTWDDPLSGEARWSEYEFPCKPGDPARRPCLVTPYHYRLDWQMWFAGLSSPEREPWVLKLVHELLRENPAVTALLARDPFVGRPPRYVRALLYRYRFAVDRRTGWWERGLLGEYLRPLSLDDPELTEFLRRRRWLDSP
jgi:hypothetical protein